MVLSSEVPRQIGAGCSGDRRVLRLPAQGGYVSVSGVLMQSSLLLLNQSCFLPKLKGGDLSLNLYQAFGSAES